MVIYSQKATKPLINAGEIQVLSALSENHPYCKAADIAQLVYLEPINIVVM